MKIPFIIYVQALGIYLLLTLPTITVPVIYLISAWYAFTCGFAAMVVFVVAFFIINRTRPGVPIVNGVLAITVLPAVAIAYKLLLVVMIPNRSFWAMDENTLFPMVAVIAGWAAIAFNIKRISQHFLPPVIEEWETLFTYQHEKV
jgi:hypothetical protein